MKICVDGLPLFLNKWDLGEYSKELISQLSKENSLFLHIIKDREIPKGSLNLNSSYVNVASLSLDRVSDNYTPIVNYLKTNSIDVYHCMNNGFSLNKDMLGSNVVTTIHSLILLEYEDYYRDSYKSKFFNALPIALKNTNKFIAPSEVMKNKLINLCNIKAEKIEVVYPIINNDFEVLNKYMSLVYLRSKYNITGDFILFTGDFHKRKRLEDLIEVFFRISSINEKLKLIFLTAVNEVNIDYFNEINMLIKSMALGSKVTFITNFSHDEKVHFMNSAACFIDLSLFDDMNVSMVQALFCKCPIICSDIPLHREILGECGIFIDMDNINSLDFIEQYIQNIKDINLYNHKDYLHNLKRFNVSDNVNKLVNIYKNIITH